jgi:hypothetical protein
MSGATFIQNYAGKTQHRRPTDQPTNLFKNLIVPELVKNLSTFCGMKIFISGVHNSPPHFFIMNQINLFHVSSFSFFKISHNHPIYAWDFQVALFFKFSQTKALYIFLISQYVPHALPVLSSLISSPK